MSVMHLHCNSEDGSSLQTKLKGIATIQRRHLSLLKVIIRIIFFNVIVICWKRKALGHQLEVLPLLL